MATTRGTTLATTHRVINRIHSNAAVVGTLSLPTHAASLAPLNVTMVKVANLANRRTAAHVNSANFTGWETNLRPVALFCHQLR